MKKLLLLFLFIPGLLSANDDKQNDGIGCKPYLSVNSAFQAVKPSSIPQFDRWLWNGRLGGGILFVECFSLEAFYEMGGLLFHGRGYSTLNGWRIGIVYHPFTHRNDFHKKWYLKLGYLQNRYPSTRNPLHSGFYCHPGIRIPIGESSFSIHQEITIEYQFSDEDGLFGQLRIGVNGGISYLLPEIFTGGRN